MDACAPVWVAVGAAGALACGGAVELRRRRELIRRGYRQLRGPLTVLRLDVATMARRGELSAVRAARLDAELRLACLALDDAVAGAWGSRLEDHLATLEVAELLEQLWASWHAVAAALGSELRLGAIVAPARIRGDRLRLMQALSNLVANALEHAPGSVELAARTHDARLRIVVADEGPGLPRPLAELTRARRRGSGGLAIAATIAGRHRGRLVEERAARGARVGLELPLADGDSA